MYVLGVLESQRPAPCLPYPSMHALQTRLTAFVLAVQAATAPIKVAAKAGKAAEAVVKAANSLVKFAKIVKRFKTAVDKIQGAIEKANAIKDAKDAVELAVGAITHDLAGITNAYVESQVTRYFSSVSREYKAICRAIVFVLAWEAASLVPDFSSIAIEIIDPTGVAGVINAFNHEKCKRAAVMDRSIIHEQNDAVSKVPALSRCNGFERRRHSVTCAECRRGAFPWPCMGQGPGTLQLYACRRTRRSRRSAVLSYM